MKKEQTEDWKKKLLRDNKDKRQDIKEKDRSKEKYIEKY